MGPWLLLKIVFLGERAGYSKSRATALSSKGLEVGLVVQSPEWLLQRDMGLNLVFSRVISCRSLFGQHVY